MEHNSPSTMGDNSTDPMDVNNGEEIETKYFNEVANFNDNMDHSIDSVQGSSNFPIFSMAQSTGLQGSQGFQISASQRGQMMNQSGGSDDIKLEYVSDFYNQQHQYQQQQPVNMQATQSVMHPAFRDDGNMSSFSTNLTQTSASGLTHTSAFTAQGGGNFNIVSMTDQAKTFTPQGGVFSSGMSYTFSGDKLSSMVKMGESTAPGSGSGGPEVGERGSGDSDEKTSGGECGGGESTGSKNKSSPKGKGRKSRATSSSSVEGQPKSDTQAGVAGPKGEATEPGSNGGETGFKPSLLDEILTEKKLALLKSPEVIRFLQSQQENLVREKSYTTSMPMDS